MNNLPKHVIEDLMPAYLAGDVSDETKNVIESAAADDESIAALIEEKKVDVLAQPGDLAAERIIPAGSLEFETLNRVRHSIRKKMLMVAFATLLILMLPLTAMNFTNEVNWDLMDFVVMGVMLMGAGLTYVFIANLSKSYAYKLAIAVSLLTGFLIVWGNLAVGFIGDAGNSANLLYLLVFAVAIWKSMRCKLASEGMSHALFYAAITLFMIPFVAISMWPAPDLSLPSLVPMFFFNTFLALLLTFAGLLFRKASKT